MQPFAIGIPTINQKDSLVPILEHYLKDYPGIPIVVLDNGNQDLPLMEGIHIHESFQNKGVAGSWNYLLYNIYKDHSDTAIILNDDIYLGRPARMKQLLSLTRHGFLLNLEHSYAFLLTKYCFYRVGEFDEAFYPAYYEDNDYAYRYSLLYHTSPKRTVLLEPQFARNSASIASNPRLNDRFAANRQRYIEKWGGLPGHERYTTPFNKPKEATSDF